MENNTQLIPPRPTVPEPVERIRARSPQVDIFENNDEIVVHADVPGATTEGLSVRLDKDELFLQARRPSLPEDSQLPLEYRRSFLVPRTVDPGRIAATLHNGVLEIRLPKRDEVRPRRITVEAVH